MSSIVHVLAVSVTLLITGFGFSMSPPSVAGWAVGAFGAVLMIAVISPTR